MKHFNIIYGYCKEANKSTIFEQLRQTGIVLKVKSIEGIHDYSVFAALVRSTVPYADWTMEGVHFVQTAIPTKPKQSNRILSTIPRLSRKKFASANLSPEEIQVYRQANRAYRKQKNREITLDNWRQHINKRAALSEVRAMLCQQPTSRLSFFLMRGQMPTPFSTAGY